jgi:hypothetical protein
VRETAAFLAAGQMLRHIAACIVCRDPHLPIRTLHDFFLK